MDRAVFFNHVRADLFRDTMTDTQVVGTEQILDGWKKYFPASDLRWLAYALGTAYHETARTMQPIREIGEGRGRAYGKPDPITKQTYYGRGYVQLTWKENYRKAGKLIGEDLVRLPDLALDPETSVIILLRGMEQGLFTGQRFVDYFNAAVEEWRSARRIVNGLDRAQEIARYAQAYHAAIMAGRSAEKRRKE